MSPQNADTACWFASEVHPHEAALRTWLRARFPSFPDIDDLVQEAYVRLFRARIVTPISDPRRFLFATARNLAVDFVRHERAVVVERMDTLDQLPLPGRHRDAAETACHRDDLSQLAAAIERLPERCRETFVLRKIVGLSQKEVAERLGITENTVAAQTATAMRRCAAHFHAPARRTRSGPVMSGSPACEN
ncbi:MAG TPA: RNA polymerase sigma factor [Opitutaceae bacterium]|nr:RNA polymerase sigma factor [Opitutaceae bacterium]